MSQTSNPDTSEPLEQDESELIARGDALIANLRQTQVARVFIVSGPSGVGKDSVLEKLQKIYPAARYVVTSTSREMRDDEIDGVHYNFLNRADFERQIEAGAYIEHELVYDNLYGVPRQPILDGLKSNQHVIIKVDVKGAATLRRLISNTVSIFLLPESMDALKERLRKRKTEEPTALMKRFRTASEELTKVEEFDYAVFNEKNRISEALATIVSIIEAEHRLVAQTAPSIGEAQLV